METYVELDPNHLWSEPEKVTLENLFVEEDYLWAEYKSEAFLVIMKLDYCALYHEKIVLFKGDYYFCTIDTRKYLNGEVNDVELKAI